MSELMLKYLEERATSKCEYATYARNMPRSAISIDKTHKAMLRCHKAQFKLAQFKHKTNL
jgi:hypothetical protein